MDANIYGLGEVVASSGFRRDVRNGTVQTMWNRDDAVPLDENMSVSFVAVASQFFASSHRRLPLNRSYGSHPVYLEHRLFSHTNTFQSHGVFLSRYVQHQASYFGTVYL